MFRFLRKTNLLSTRRRSSSCPNLEHAIVADEVQENKAHKNNAFKSSSESDSSATDTPNKFERRKAQQSVRRGHMKEKEKQENTQKNLISMDDYLGKLSELKTWLKEERKKDVDNMRSPKLKTHFKTFVKLWNKRKLPLKYYRGCSVNLYIDEKSLPQANSDSTNKLINPQFSLVEDAAKYSLTDLLPPFDLSCDNLLDGVSSPFSTFGKCDDIITSPGALPDKMNIATSFDKHREDGSSQNCFKYSQDMSTPVKSPTKFATISRSIPATSRLHNFTAQPWRSGVNTVHSINFLDPQSRLADSSSPATPTTSSTLPSNYKPDEHIHSNNTEPASPSWTKPTGPSPVYSSIIDAIPYSTGSPKYAEIDESIQIPLQRLPSSGYCSLLMPSQEWRSPHTNLQPAVSKKQSLNRRRSKSLDDIYSIPSKAEVCAKVISTLDEEDVGQSETPPIPNREYSPLSPSATCSDHRFNKSAAVKDYSHIPSFQTTPVSSPGSASQKRRSQEDAESDQHSTSLLKKSKSTWLSNSDLETTENEDASPKCSILTGSLNPTTRSRYKINDENVIPPEPSSVKCCEPRLSILEIKQLDESPKLPRRKLKRLSSSLSTTPGKGLLFGKSSKMSVSSPKRVSFAKNVKETEKTAALGKLFSMRRCAPQNFTKQTIERKEFESFLSAHESPPRKSNSPSNKVPSPDKNSLLNNNTPTRRNSPQTSLIDVTTVISESQDNIARKRLFNYKENDNNSYGAQLSASSLSSTSTLSDAIQGDRIFPPSSVRQVGRRVIGAPKASPAKSISGDNQPLSPRKIPENSTQIASPQKNLPAACLAPSHQTSVTTTSHLSSPQKNLPAACPAPSHQTSVTTTSHLSSPQNNYKTSSLLFSSPKQNKESTFSTTSHTSPKNLGLKKKSVSPDKNLRYATNSSSLYNMRTSSNNLLSSKYQAIVSPQKPSESGSQLKDLTRSHSSTKKVLVSSVVTSKKSIQSLVSKLTEKTTTICAKELSESDDYLSSDDVLVAVPEVPPLVIKSPERDSQNQDLIKENGDFKVATLESSPCSKAKETDICSKSSSAVCTEAASAKTSDFLHTSETSPAAMDPCHHHHYTKESSSLTLDKRFIVQSTEEACRPDSLAIKDKSSSIRSVVKSKELVGQPAYAASTGWKTQDISHHTSETTSVGKQYFHLPVNGLTKEYKQPKNSFHPKEIPSKLKPSCISTSTDSDSEVGYKKYDEDIQPFEDLFESIESNVIATSLGVDCQSNSSLVLNPHFCKDGAENVGSVSEDTIESPGYLRRISSIRASPKIVENDGWITERRRSSKGKSLHSFRAAYNRHLLKSSKEEEGNEFKIEQVAIEETLPWTPDFASVSAGESISLEFKENIQDMSKKSHENLSSDISIEKNNKPYGASTETKSVVGITKTRPPTLPKPSKTALLANRKLPASTGVVSNTGKTASKQRSSLARKDLALTPSSRNSIESHMVKSRVSVGKDKSRERLSVGKDKPRERLSVGKDKPRERLSIGKDKPRERLSVGKDKSRERLSVGKDQSRERLSSGKDKSSKRVSGERSNNLITQTYNEHDKCFDLDEHKKPAVKDSDAQLADSSRNIGDTHKDSGKLTSSSRPRQPEQIARKRSSNGAGDNQVGRRRSKGKTEENKGLSFAEKKKFFSQLHANVNKANESTLGTSSQSKGSPQKQNQRVRFAAMSSNDMKSKAESPRKTLVLGHRSNLSSHSTV